MMFDRYLCDRYFQLMLEICRVGTAHEPNPCEAITSACCLNLGTLNFDRCLLDRVYLDRSIVLLSQKVRSIAFIDLIDRIITLDHYLFDRRSL
jgi:hypothetical protein